MWIGAFPVIVKTSLLEHRQELIVAERVGRGAGRLRERRYLVTPIRRRYFVLCRDSGLAEEIRVALRSRELDADGLERPAIQRTVDDVPRKRWTWDGIPLHDRVPLIAPGAHASRSGRCGRLLLRSIVVHADLIDDERMPQAVGASLPEDDGLETLRVEGVNGRGGKIGQRDARLHPAAGRNVSRVAPERQRLRERS